jgi:hypothetical protein
MIVTTLVLIGLVVVTWWDESVTALNSTPDGGGAL